MGLRRKSGKAPHDQTTKSLLNQGVYRVEVQDHELGLFHRRHAAYSFWSGVKYILILSVLLWWLPTVGQMIAGYVGGRRTGSAWKAVIAAILPLALIFGLSYAVDHGYVGLKADSFATLPATVVQQISNSVPAIAPYASFVVQYIAAFVVAMQTTLSMGSNGYLVTIVFGYIGGLMAEQAHRETMYAGRSGVGVSITQPILHTNQGGDSTLVKRKEPVGFQAMKRLPATLATAETNAPAKRQKPRQESEVDSATIVPASKQPGTRESPRQRSAKDQARLEHFVQQALRRYDSEHR